MVEIRSLERHEIGDLWSTDRAEVVDDAYHLDGDELVLEPRHFDIRGWPPGEPELYGPILLDCFDHGGTFYGAFDGGTLIGVAVLESRFIGSGRRTRSRSWSAANASPRSSSITSASWGCRAIRSRSSAWSVSRWWLRAPS